MHNKIKTNSDEEEDKMKMFKCYRRMFNEILSQQFVCKIQSCITFPFNFESDRQNGKL